MTLERPSDLNDLAWNSVLATNEVTATLWLEDPVEGWQLSVRAVVFPAAGMYRTIDTSLAHFEYPGSNRPADSSLDRAFAGLGLSRIDEWEEVSDADEDPEYSCRLSITASQSAEGRAYIAAENEKRARDESAKKHAQAVESFATWRGWTIFLAVAGAAINLLALAPFPASDYRLFRLGICAVSVALIFLTAAHKSWGWLFFLLPAAVLWNPILRVFASRGTWAPLNIAAVVAFAALAYWAINLRPPSHVDEHVVDTAMKDV